MIIIDYSAIAIAGYVATVGVSKSRSVSPYGDDGGYNNLDISRSIILESIAQINSRFKKTYGELVIAVDSPRSWRHQAFPYYKVKRKKLKQKSEFNWEELYENINIVADELVANFPYRTLKVNGAEADDIIGALTLRNVANYKDTLIVSKDKDFVQLQRGTVQVRQWSNIDKEFITSSNPKFDLFEHIMRGDQGDSIPNVLSPIDSFAVGTRQKAMYTKKIEEWFADPSTIPSEYAPRINQNRKLIDLTQMPESVREACLRAYDTYDLSRDNIQNYCMENGLVKVHNRIGDFY